jgi:hypothetical protein
MKPAWDQLTEEYKDSTTALIVDVDCTNDKNEDLCSKYEVEGFPTIKYFTDATDPLGDNYEGGRDFDDLKEFADANLGPTCSYNSIDLCSDEQKKEIEEVAAMDPEERGKLIDDAQQAAKDAEAKFEAEVEKLQAQYEKLVEEKDAAIAATKPTLKKYRAVHMAMAAKSENAETKDEL